MERSTHGLHAAPAEKQRKRTSPRRVMSIGAIVALLVSVFSFGTHAAQGANLNIGGTLVAGTINTALGSAGVSPTLPRGVAWLADTSAAGGHWWVGDQLNGLCRLDPLVGAANNGPFTLAQCNATAKSGGQIIVGNVPGTATAKFIYVADDSSRSTKVVRYRINGVNTANPTSAAPLVMTVPNITQKGGGLSGGRPVALALITNPGTLPVPAAPGFPAAYVAGEEDLVVGYLKSGDIVRVFDVNHTAAAAPAQAVVGSTSDGIGVNAFAVVGGDLYVAEVGGLGGVSKVVDIAGVNRLACSPSSPCTAVPTGSGIGFPGGLAADGGQYLYVGDSARGGASNNIYRVNLATSPLTTDTVSSTVPTFSAKDSNQVQTTYNTYTSPVALGYRPTAAGGELYVGGDPQILAAVVTNQQGHIWSILTPPAPPAVSTIAPTSGPQAGGTAVTITGANFIVGAATATFGAAGAVPAVCATTTSCVATSPAAAAPGTVDLTVTSGGQTSAAVNADKFTYNATVPTITSISPANGSEAGGTTITITGSGFASGASVTVDGVAATSVTCASTTTCTATTAAEPAAPATPVGTPTPVTITVAGISATAPAAFTYDAVSITSVAPASGDVAGGTVVTLTGVGFSTTLPGRVAFDGLAPVNATCTSTTTCTATAPNHVAGGPGPVPVTITFGTKTSPAATFTYTTTVVVGPVITNIGPLSGSNAGGTVVTINGSGLASATITVGGVAVPASTCTASSCAFDTPSTTTTGAAAIVVTDATLAPPVSVNAGQFTYVQAAASLFGFGITAPKGGAVWLPGALGGHWWSSDHAQGFCRQDPLGGGSSLSAINYSVCGDDLVGSAGQGVYDPRAVTVNGQTFSNLHYVYVPDNAVKSTAVWRLTFDSNTETMVADPIDGVTTATAMIPLANVTTLKPNGMALGPLNANGVFCGLAGSNCSAAQNAAIGLYVTDLTEPNVRFITKPDGDPRQQLVSIVAATGDGRGANGTAGFIGSYLYVSGNRATQFFDVTLCPIGGITACGMASVPSPVGVFVAGTAVDPINKFVYQSNSPGGAAASLLRYDASHDVYAPFSASALPPGVVVDNNGVVHCEANVGLGNAGIGCLLGPKAGNYLNGGTLPGFGGPIVVATGPSPVGATRPWDFTNHPTAATNFGFAFGLAVGPNNELVITEDPSAGVRSGRGTMWTAAYTG